MTASSLPQGAKPQAFVLTVQCASRRGIVAAISTFLAEQGCNITDAAQFDDDLTGKFFSRISFRAETGTSPETLRAGFADQSHLTRVFKRVVGVPLGAYRRR